MDTLLQDLRYCFRAALRNPGMTMVAVLTLTVGIGANTAIFSVVYAVWLQPLPFREPNDLMWLTETKVAEGANAIPVSPATFIDWRSQQTRFDQLAAYSEGSYTITGGTEPEELASASVSFELLPMLGVRPALGRSFLPEEDKPGANQVAILSDELWRRRFASDPGIVGRSIVLSQRSYDVIGVMPPQFDYPGGAQLWTPLMPTLSPDTLTARGAHLLKVLGRVKSGNTITTAEADLAGISHKISESESEYSGMGVRLTPLHEHITGESRGPLILLSAAVAFVLLISCVNVANLLLARGSSRVREVAVRQALGAGRARMVRQLLTESAVVALSGGLVGTLVAALLLPTLIAISPISLPRVGEARLNGQVLAFTAIVSLATVFLFGLAPSLLATRPAIATSLKTVAGSLVGRRNGLATVLVGSEFALTLVLLAGAGLMVRSFVNLLRVDPGFKPEHLLSFKLVLPMSRYPGALQETAFVRSLFERIQALPQVRSVGLTRNLPASGQTMTSALRIEGRPTPQAENRVEAEYSSVSQSYFRAMGIPLLKGRFFADQDNADGAPVSIINETLARRCFEGEDPIGKKLRGFFGRPVMREVVGVIGDVRHSGPAVEVPPQLFAPYEQDPARNLVIVVRTEADPGNISGWLKSAIWSLDKDLPVESESSMRDLLSRSVAQPRFNSLLLAGFAGLALSLAAIGIYGLMSYSVAQSTSEIGIRMALGASRSDVVSWVIRRGMTPVLAGIAVGLGGAVAATRLISGILYGVRPVDPATFATATIMLAIVALAALYLPALKATKVQPMDALRYE
jgi:putative ABC transport system permease protein